MKKKILIPMVLLGLSVVSSCGEKPDDRIDSTPSVESTHVHTYSDEYSKDANRHWHFATCGHNIRKDEAIHTYSDWTVVNAATTTEKGLEKRECSVCGYTETRNISVLKINITFNFNGGSVVDNISLNSGDYITASPTKDKCVFQGWYDETLTTKYEKVPQSDITLYAKWCDLSDYDYQVSYYPYEDITITKYTGSDTEVVIPEGVTIIQNNAFQGCSSLTSITIPNSVTSIYGGTFSDCSNLTSITIPDSVTSIGYDAFSGCSSLASITIPEGVIIIENNAFQGCSSLTSVTIPNSVTSIGYDAFYECSNLTSINIPESVTSIENGAFYDCYRLVEVINESSLNINKGDYDYGYVGKYALDVKNSGESSIVNKDGYLFYTVDNINYLVGYTGSETELVLPNDYNGESYIINKYAFYNYSNLTSVVISEGVTSIGASAFASCSKLASITIPSSVTSIGFLAFSDCNLVEVINKSSLNITKGSFDFGQIGSHALEVKNSGESSIVNKDGYLFYTVDNINYLVGYTGSETALVLPANYNGKSYVINKGAFYNCSNLTSIKIPNSVTSIGDFAFSYCSSLASITIPEGVIIIENNTFEGCSNLTSITIPDSVTSIGDSAFSNCSNLTSVVISDSVTSIGYDAFYGCSSLVSITIPDSVTSIGFHAFLQCDNLEYNEYDNGYYLGNDTNPYLVLAKAKSSDITSCEININCKFMLEGVFSGCTSLTSIIIPDSVTRIGYNTFEGCTNLANVIIGNSVTSIYDSSFKGCTNLTSIIIPNSVTSIGSAAFENCSNLTSVVLPSNVSSTGKDIFYNCTSLTSVYFNGPVSKFWYKEWACLDSATIYYYSETQPTDADYKYWHYVDGEITEW